MLRTRLFSRPERASPDVSLLQVGEKRPHNRMWLTTAVHDYHACPTAYPGVNEVPTLRATDTNSHSGACHWSLDVTSIGVMHNVTMYASSWTKSSIIITVKRKLLTHLSTANLTLFLAGDCHLNASTISVNSLWRIILRVQADSKINYHRTGVYECRRLRFDIVFHGLWAETPPNMR